MNVDGRDFIAEMNARIGEATAGSGWVAAIVAGKLAVELGETDPDLLDGWLRAMAVPLLTRVIGLHVHAERSARKRGARRRAFAAAAGAFEVADDRGPAAVVLLGMFGELHVVDAGQTRKRAGDMTGPEHLFVAEVTYQRTANTALMLAAFHRAVAGKVGSQRTADVLSEAEYERLYLSITSSAA